MSKRGSEVNNVSRAVLSKYGIRRILENNIAQIKKLESLEGTLIRNLTLKDAKINDAEEEVNIMLSYEAIASKEFYSRFEGELIEKGVAKLDNMISSNRFNDGKPNEYEQVNMGFSENSMQVFLRIYNPKYQG